MRVDLHITPLCWCLIPGERETDYVNVYVVREYAWLCFRLRVGRPV
jgi:hypothetical protein